MILYIYVYFLLRLSWPLQSCRFPVQQSQLVLCQLFCIFREWEARTCRTESVRCLSVVRPSSVCRPSVVRPSFVHRLSVVRPSSVRRPSFVRPLSVLPSFLPIILLKIEYPTCHVTAVYINECLYCIQVQTLQSVQLYTSANLFE